MSPDSQLRIQILDKEKFSLRVRNLISYHPSTKKFSSWTSCTWKTQQIYAHCNLQLPRQISNKATTEHLKLNTKKHFNLFGAIPADPAMLRGHKKIVSKKQDHTSNLFFKHSHKTNSA